MKCEFQSLYFDDDGFVVRCKQCGHYQLAFCRIMLTMTEFEFQVFCKEVINKCIEADNSFSAESKTVILQTPSQGVWIILTPSEVKHFKQILEEADIELKSQALISLFNP